MSIGVAIIGGGIFAREQHKPAVLATSALALKAVYSRSLKSAQSLETSEDVKLYSDDSPSGQNLDDLLARGDIQAVIIALPILTQPSIIRKALLAGKHVLSEKPVAENIKVAKELIHWYRHESGVDVSKVFWSVAENQRFFNNFVEAAKARQTQGKVLTFRIRVQNLIQQDFNYYQTSWRKVPEYQGGFLLDGGVHYTAGLRLLLGPENPITTISAHTAQFQDYLPPTDTIEATARTKNGGLGVISISVGTTAKGREWTVGSENGVVSVGFDEITVDGKSREVKNEGSGVEQEVRAWADAMSSGKIDSRQTPEEALADLSLIEAMLKSGEQGGVPMAVENQEIEHPI